MTPGAILRASCCWAFINQAHGAVSPPASRDPAVVPVAKLALKGGDSSGRGWSWESVPVSELPACGRVFLLPPACLPPPTSPAVKPLLLTLGRAIHCGKGWQGEGGTDPLGLGWHLESGQLTCLLVPVLQTGAVLRSTKMTPPGGGHLERQAGGWAPSLNSEPLEPTVSGAPSLLGGPRCRPSTAVEA